MPKKFKGENSKAAEAKARKNAVKAEEDAAKQKALEDEMWRDDDKHVARKQQRKEGKEKKRQEQLQNKKEKEELLEQEMAALKNTKPAPSVKVTRLEIEQEQKRMAKEQAAAKGGKTKVVDEDEPLEQNLNRLAVEDGARNVDEAISVLSSKGEPEVDMHPEKRMKAAYKAYEEKNLPLLKAENPNMRLSQLKQMLKKDWMKCPENPMVQFQMAKMQDS